MDGMTHRCRICNGDRPHNGLHCQGCGTEIVRCKPAKTKRSSACHVCAHTGPHKLIEAGRFRCLKCTAVFEGPDVGYLDDRPDVNLEKAERLIEEAKRRKAMR